MNQKRSGGSSADNVASTLALREDSSSTRSLEALEKCGCWRTLCMINKFEPLVELSDVEDEEDWDVYLDDTEESSNTWTAAKRKSKSGRKSKPKPINAMSDKEITPPHANVPRPNNLTHSLTQSHNLGSVASTGRLVAKDSNEDAASSPQAGQSDVSPSPSRGRPHRAQHQNAELLSVSESSDNPDETLYTAENVMGQQMAPGTAIKPSVDSCSGVQYTTANGSSVPNRGEKEVKVVTSEGQKCVLRMQVKDVTKALMSVSSICDAGHRVVFERAGGYIEHEATNTWTQFKREDGVYGMMKVRLADYLPGVTRPGR